MTKFRFVVLIVVLALVAAACGTATPAPTQPPAQSAVEATATEVQPTPVATIAADLLAQKGHLLICSDFPYPPQEFYDDNGEPQGLDVDLGNEIGKRLGLKVQWVNSVFDTIIAAVTSGKCDIILSAQNITTDRQKQVSMIPYFQAGQSFVAQKGNPSNVKEPLDVCGKAVAAESGTTMAMWLQSTGDFEGAGLTQMCQEAGKEAPNVIVTQKDSDALQQLQSGKVAVYFTDSPVAGYYVVQHPDLFEVVGGVVDPVLEGISVPCGQEDCTNAPLSAVGQAVKTVLDSMMKDGTYLEILKKWNLETGAIQP